MMHLTLDRRRQVYAQERRERASGKWSPWEKVSTFDIAAAQHATETEFGGPAKGWARDFHTVWRNGWLVVNVRTARSLLVGQSIEHASFRTALNAELTWKEKQRIKDDLFGPNFMAIEVQPRAADLVDGADMYHLWVFPEGYRFDFGLHV